MRTSFILATLLDSSQVTKITNFGHPIFIAFFSNFWEYTQYLRRYKEKIKTVRFCPAFGFTPLYWYMY